ncbi:MAG TPA: hypothetical protein VMU45_01645 [Candidatus Eisenbacteria bacterium]|nr:hypothetical protein [Candidatus Eisenbacteria bacterium]
MKPFFHTGRTLSQKWMAAIFVLVMIGFGFVQAVHGHDTEAGQSTAASHCPLCVVAHSAAIVTSVNIAPAPVIQAVSLELPEPQLESRLQIASSYIRPPPQNL